MLRLWKAHRSEDSSNMMEEFLFLFFLCVCVLFLLLSIAITVMFFAGSSNSYWWFVCTGVLAALILSPCEKKAP